MPVERATWSDADFEDMGWQDAAVHALGFEPAMPHPGRFLVDLDYIVEWVAPEEPDTAFRFWIAPATLAFDAASDLVANVDLSGQAFELSLESLVRSESDKNGIRTWTLAGHEFHVRLRARGFRQVLRRRPVLSASQRLPEDQRGGIGFGLEGFPC